jgi:hypothetical protein
MIYLQNNVCVNEIFAINLERTVSVEIPEKCGYAEPKPKIVKSSKMSKQTLIMIIMLAICAVSFCILVGLILYRKFCDKRSPTPTPSPTRKATTLADLTISETIITEIKPWPVDDSDSVDSIELIAHELIKSRATDSHSLDSIELIAQELF